MQAIKKLKTITQLNIEGKTKLDYQDLDIVGSTAQSFKNYTGQDCACS
jgi:hypothetical protein